MLGFPGGITIEFEPLQDNSTVEVVQPIFNVTLDRSIRQLRGLIEEMKEDLGHLLEEVPYELHPFYISYGFFLSNF